MGPLRPMKAPLPPNEPYRLHMLQLYRLLDSANEKVFDDLTRLAAAICDVPISLVSLVDQDRQWFKSRFGLDALETHRDSAFCSHAILEDEIFIVEDTHNDERFLDNPLVLGDPSIRFYAGAPLQVEGGERLGTLCVIDRVPRVLDAAQLEALSVLREAVVAQMELRRTRLDMQALNQVMPICAWCRSVRKEGENGPQWIGLHEYITEAVPVTHGICPPCKDTALGD